MGSTTEQLAFKKIFAEALREKVNQNGIHLDTGEEDHIAEKFIYALIELKTALEKNALSRPYNKGEISWSAEREKIISNFAEKLHHVFEKVGGLRPEHASAYWSGPAVKRAAEFGTDFASTIPGFVVNQVHAALQETFTKKAYTPDGMLDTATNVGMWDAMSKLYAEGTISDAHVFLVDGETSQQSIFWNTELQTLRKRQATGQVNQIYVHTLTNEALLKYRGLVEEKKGAEPNSEQFQKIVQQTDKLLKDESSWTKTDLDSSKVFKLKTSGFNGPHKTIDYQVVKACGNRFKERLASIKQSGVKSDAANTDEDQNRPKI